MSLLYDDANPVLTYYGTQWAHSTDVGAVFNGTISVCHAEIQNTTLPPSLSLNFYGKYQVSSFSFKDCINCW
jgi:hypothetical protein